MPKKITFDWDTVIVKGCAIAIIGFVGETDDRYPLVVGWAFIGSSKDCPGYTPRELQRISEAYWKDKPLPKLADALKRG